MNLDELRSVQSKERQKDSLQNLRPSFYREVGEYIADLEDERDRAAERAEDPFSSPEVSRLTDEIETAKDVVEAIYERRMGKLVKQASLAAAGMPADDEGLTAEEADLFDDLVDRIGENKTRVLDVLEGIDPDAAAPDESAAEPESDRAPEPGTAPESGVDADRPADGAPETSDPAAGRAGPADEDAPPVPPQEPPADADTASDESAPSSGVSPADVMGGEPSSIDGAESDGGPEVGPGTETDSAPTPPTPPADDGAPAPSSKPDSGPDAAPPGGSDAASDDAGGESAVSANTDTNPNANANSSDDDVERTTVRITRDVGSILGIDDREYSLSSEDIVTLPEQNAAPLLEQDAAEPLE